MASSVCQALVTMQWPVTRLTSMDKPMQPSMVVIIGCTSSRTNAIPESIFCGSPMMVIDRAYTPHSLSQRRPPSDVAGTVHAPPGVAARQEARPGRKARESGR